MRAPLRDVSINKQPVINMVPVPTMLGYGFWRAIQPTILNMVPECRVTARIELHVT